MDSPLMSHNHAGVQSQVDGSCQKTPPAQLKKRTNQRLCNSSHMNALSRSPSSSRYEGHVSFQPSPSPASISSTQDGLSHFHHEFFSSPFWRSHVPCSSQMAHFRCPWCTSMIQYQSTSSSHRSAPSTEVSALSRSSAVTFSFSMIYEA